MLEQAAVLEVLQRRLPAGWTGSILKPSAVASGAPIDAMLSIKRKGAAGGAVRVSAKGRVEPKDVDYLAVTLRPTPEAPMLIVAPFLSPRTQERLRSRGFAYADLTGNMMCDMSDGSAGNDHGWEMTGLAGTATGLTVAHSHDDAWVDVCSDF